MEGEARGMMQARTQGKPRAGIGRRAFPVVALLASVLPPATARAASCPADPRAEPVQLCQETVITASEPGFIRVQVTEEIRWDLTRSHSWPPDAPVRIDGEGDLIGFILAEEPPPAGSGGFVLVGRTPRVPGLSDYVVRVGEGTLGGVEPLACLPSICVPAGTYRLYVLADGGPVRITLRPPGPPGSVSLVPLHQADFSSRALPNLFPAGGVDGRWYAGEVPVLYKERRFVLPLVWMYGGEPWISGEFGVTQKVYAPGDEGEWHADWLPCGNPNNHKVLLIPDENDPVPEHQIHYPDRVLWADGVVFSMDEYAQVYGQHDFMIRTCAHVVTGRPISVGSIVSSFTLDEGGGQVQPGSTPSPSPTSDDERTFYVLRTGCLPDQRLSAWPRDSWPNKLGCGRTDSLTPLNEVSRNGTDYETVDGVPFTLDASRPIRGVASQVGFYRVLDGGVGAGATSIDVSLSATLADGETKSLGSTTVSYLATPSQWQHDVPWQVTPPAELDGAEVTRLVLRLVVRGYNVLHGYTRPIDTYLKVPVSTAG